MAAVSALTHRARMVDLQITAVKPRLLPPRAPHRCRARAKGGDARAGDHGGSSCQTYRRVLCPKSETGLNAGPAPPTVTYSTPTMARRRSRATTPTAAVAAKCA